MNDIVLGGYRLPFLSYPDSILRMNHVSVRDEAEFVSVDIDNLHA